jgi:hypothetical protein
MDEWIRLLLEAEVSSGSINGLDNISYSVPVVRALDFWFRFMVFDFNVVVILFIDLYSQSGSFCDKSC